MSELVPTPPHKLTEMEKFFAGERSAPVNLTKDEWVFYLAHACKEHRTLAWRVADLLALGMDRFGEAYYTLVERTGYEPGYLSKIEGWIRRGIPVTRRELLRKHPECEEVPHSWWEAVGPFRDDQGRPWGEPGCDQKRIIETRISAILAGWSYEGGRMETHVFKSFCVEYRRQRGDIDAKPHGQLEPGSPTKEPGSSDSNTVDAEFRADEEKKVCPHCGGAL